VVAVVPVIGNRLCVLTKQAPLRLTSSLRFSFRGELHMERSPSWAFRCFTFNAVAASLLFSGLTLHGQTTQQSLPTAKEVLDRYAKALGGRETMYKHTSMTVHGKQEYPEKHVSLDHVLYYKGGKRLEKITLPDGSAVVAGFDGKIGWEVAANGTASLHQGDEASSWKRDADMFYPARVLDYFQSMEVVDATDFQGHTCYHLRGTNNWGKLNEQFYDKESGLLVGYRFDTRWRGGTGTAIMVFSDYKDFSGWLMPTRTLYKEAKLEVFETVTSVSFDDVDDSIFVLPQAVQTLVQPGNR